MDGDGDCAAVADGSVPANQFSSDCITPIQLLIKVSQSGKWARER